MLETVNRISLKHFTTQKRHENQRYSKQFKIAYTCFLCSSNHGMLHIDNGN